MDYNKFCVTRLKDEAIFFKYISTKIILLIIFNFISVSSLQFSFIDQLFYLCLFAVVSLNEEIAMRGYILQNLSSSFNKYIALALSSLVFMIMHIGNPNMSAIPLLNLFLAGLFLGIYCIFLGFSTFSVAPPQTL